MNYYKALNMDALQESGWARCVTDEFSNVGCGEVLKIEDIVTHEAGPTIIFEDVFGFYHPDNFKPASEEEYEKWKLQDALK